MLIEALVCLTGSRAKVEHRPEQQQAEHQHGERLVPAALLSSAFNILLHQGLRLTLLRVCAVQAIFHVYRSEF